MRQVISLFVLMGFFVLVAVCLLGLAFGGGMLLVLLSGDNVAVYLLGGLAPAALAARDGAVWLPYEEFTRAERHRDIPIKATVTLHGGAAHKIHAAYTSYCHGNSHHTIVGVLRQYG